MGFKECGATVDCFRASGIIIEKWAMLVAAISATGSIPA